jgi:hypothetical protein
VLFESSIRSTFKCDYRTYETIQEASKYLLVLHHEIAPAPTHMQPHHLNCQPLWADISLPASKNFVSILQPLLSHISIYQLLLDPVPVPAQSLPVSHCSVQWTSTKVSVTSISLWQICQLLSTFVSLFQPLPHLSAFSGLQQPRLDFVNQTQPLPSSVPTVSLRQPLSP